MCWYAGGVRKANRSWLVLLTFYLMTDFSTSSLPSDTQTHGYRISLEMHAKRLLRMLLGVFRGEMEGGLNSTYILEHNARDFYL